MEELFVSYLCARFFIVIVNDVLSEEFDIPQGNILEPLVYVIYTPDMPTLNQVILATFANYIVILAANSDLNSAQQNKHNISA